MEYIKKIFVNNEPELVLISFNNQTAIFQLLDCDGYRLGNLIFEEVTALSLPTQWQSYQTILIYQKDIAGKFNLNEELISEEYNIYILIPNIDEESLFVNTNNFIVSKNIVFQEETNLGRGK